MRTKDFVISDWHFGHYNIIKYCNRPFESVEEMNDVMIQRHNARVRKNDRCWVLGDIGSPGADKLTHIVEKLNGHKILIKGNHDRYSNTTYYQMGFKAVLEGGKQRLQKGISIIVFPQTTRTVRFEPENFNSIGVKLAQRAKVPIIPLALRTDAKQMPPTPCIAFLKNSRRLISWTDDDSSLSMSFRNFIQRFLIKILY